LIPIKKIQLNSIGLGSYGQNQIKLQFLPNIIAYLTGLVLFLLILFYFNIAGLAFPDFNSRNTSPEAFVSVKKELTIESITSNTDTLTRSQNINFLNSQNSCQLQSQKSISQETLFSSLNSGFWVPQNCSSNLSFVQIVKLNPEDVVKLSQNNNLESFLISNNIYILVYKTSQESTGLDFSPYLVDLAQPVFPSEISFIEATSYDLSTSNNLKFYLVGQCQDFTNNKCQLLLLDTNTGRRSTVFSNFLELLKNNDLPANSVVKFAKIQDSSPTAVNIIIYQKANQSIILVRIGMDNSLPIQSLKINIKGEPEVFNKYYR